MTNFVCVYAVCRGAGGEARDEPQVVPPDAEETAQEEEGGDLAAQPLSGSLPRKWAGSQKAMKAGKPEVWQATPVPP